MAPPTLDERWLASVAPPHLSPRVFRLVDAIVPRRFLGLTYERADAMRAAYGTCERELPRTPELACVGFAMLAPDRSVEERRQACVWLTLFPSDEMVDALAGVLLDERTPAPLRDQAAWSLGFRQAQERDDALLWPTTAIARANDAIVEAWHRGLGASLPELLAASRHVDDPRLFAWMGEHLDEAWPAVEAFADAGLARAILERLATAPEEHVHRAIRLAAHVLGAEASDPLTRYAREAPVAPRLEALFAAVALGSTGALDALDAAIAQMAFPGPSRAKREAYLASGGASYHVRALRAARTTATLPAPERRAACVAACADFARLSRIDAIHEAYLHSLWRHVAFGARDAESVIGCAEGSPQALAKLPALAEPYVVALCKAGRFRDAASTAVDAGLAGRAAWELARHGRPFAALRVAASVRERTVWSAAGESLASFLAGRVDLAQAALDTFEPNAQALWDAHDTADPVARAVLERDIVALASRSVAVSADADTHVRKPDRREGADADTDVFDMACLDEAERRLRPRLDGRCVLLAGFTDRSAPRAALEALGARVVDAPFGRVDVCVVPDEEVGVPIDPRLVVRSVPVVTLSRALRGGGATLPAPADGAPLHEGPMPQLPRPRRVILLAPVLELGAPDRVANGRIADLLGALVAGFLVRHPLVALPDPDMQHFHDGLGKNVAERQLFNRAFGDFFDNILRQEFGDNQRDEVFWLELTLDPQRPVTAKLVTQRAGQQQPESFAAIGGPALSAMLQHCFDQWLQARQLPPSPDPFPPFSVQDFMNAARVLVQADQANDTGVDMAHLFDSFGGPLFPAFVRAGWKMMVMNDLHRRLVGRVLQHAPNDLSARRIEWLYRSNDGKADIAEMKQIAQAAPNWSFPYMALRGKGVGDDEAMRSQLTAAFLTPSNDGAWMNLAYAFEKTTRYDAAWRIADRMIARDPADAGLYLAAVPFMRQTEREGDTFREAVARHHAMMQQAQDGQLNVQGFTQVQAAEFYVAIAHLDVGRLDEAIAIGGKAIGEDDGQRLQWQQKQLKEWRTSPQVVGNSYAREGHFRGDPARVVEGFGRGEPDCAGDAAKLIDAHIALGDDKIAPIAFAHMHGAKHTIWHPVGRLAGVRALLAGGESLAAALEHLQVVVLRETDAKIEPEVERLLRLGAARPLREWEGYIAQRRATGALRLAKMAARDAADFVPGAEGSAVVREALGVGGAPRAFDPASLASLKASFEGIPAERLAAVDRYFAERTQPTLAMADRLAVDWAPSLAPDDETDAPVRMAEMLVYFAGALGRYLAATTQPPSVLAGGYRRLATNALAAAAAGSGPVRRAHVRALLEAVEANAAGVDPWVLDPWLLRLERLWSLEVHEGDMRDLTGALPVVADLLRGPMQIGLEYRRAHALKDANAGHAEACALLERSVRALGKSEPFQAWTQVAVMALPPAQALDVHWLCALANPTAAPPWINVAKSLFAAGQADAAFEALVRAFPATGKDWRQARLAELRPLWEQARVPVPFDFAAASNASMQLMQQGQFEAALGPTRWCDSIDPNNATIKRNLGICYARLGRAFDAVLVLSQADAESGPAQAAQALREANFPELSLLVYRYASPAFRGADSWLALGGMAWQAEDDATGAAAYATAHELSGGRLTSTQLNAWATTLLGVGDYAKAAGLLEEVMRRNDDPSIAPYVLHGMARALLGLGRPQEALSYAQAAAARAPAQSAQEFAVTMQHAQRGAPPPLKAQPPSGPAFAALRASDPKGAIEAARRVPNDARARRAALVASRYRFPTDNDTPVTRTAIDTALALLQSTAGATDLDGALGLYDAARTCASALFAVNAPPPLGASMSRDAFRAKFAASSQPPGFAQAQAAQQAVQGGAAGDLDPVVFPGQRVARLSDYVRIMKGMQSGNPMGALAQAGLDMQAYTQVAMQWGQAMQRDPTLVAKFQRLMTQ
jgi:tetratricopeptide (TPR) repeat protein